MHIGALVRAIGMAATSPGLTLAPPPGQGQRARRGTRIAFAGFDWRKHAVKGKLRPAWTYRAARRKAMRRPK